MITEQKIGETIVAIAKSFDDELLQKTESELEDYWHFKWDDAETIESNLYQFYDMLELYLSFCRRWEEKHNGVYCIVGRIRDKYTIPKIKELTKKIKIDSRTLRKQQIKKIAERLIVPSDHCFYPAISLFLPINNDQSFGAEMHEFESLKQRNDVLKAWRESMENLLESILEPENV